MKILYYDDFIRLYENRSKSKWRNPYKSPIRSIYESIIPKEVTQTLNDWKHNGPKNCVLIGGLALSFYDNPRYTEDVDFIFLTKDDIPHNVNNFSKPRAHAFRHRRTGVEVETLDSDFLKIPEEIVDIIFDTCIESDGIKIASPMAIIYMKMPRYMSGKNSTDGYQQKKSITDHSDIVNLITYCRENNIELDLSPFSPSEEMVKAFDEIVSSTGFLTEQNHYVLELRHYISENTPVDIMKFDKYDVCIFYDGYEPRFHIGENLYEDIEKFHLNESFDREYNKFIYSISVYNPIIDGKLNIRDSSTGYNTFNTFTKEERIITKWVIENKREIRNRYEILKNKQ